MDNLYSLKRAAELLNVTVRTLYTWRREGKTSFIKVGNCNKMYKKEIKRLRGEGKEEKCKNCEWFDEECEYCNNWCFDVHTTDKSCEEFKEKEGEVK